MTTLPFLLIINPNQMKKKYLAFILALVVMAGVGVAYTQNMGNLQGKFPIGGSLAPIKVISLSETWSLDPSSPSGDHDTDTNDKILIFNIKAGATDVDFTAGLNIDFSFTADNDFNSSANGTEVSLLDATGMEVGKGYIVIYSGSQAYASVYFTVSDGVASGATGTYSLYTDTATLLNEDTGEDDPFGVSLLHASGGATAIAGHTLNY